MISVTSFLKLSAQFTLFSSLRSLPLYPIHFISIIVCLRSSRLQNWQHPPRSLRHVRIPSSPPKRPSSWSYKLKIRNPSRKLIIVLIVVAIRIKVTNGFAVMNTGSLLEVKKQPYRNAVINGTTSLFINITCSICLVVAMVTTAHGLVLPCLWCRVPVWVRSY